MTEPLFRLTRPGDEEQLRKIWLRAYGSDAACVDAYFRLCYQPGLGVTAEADGCLCSAIHWIEGYILRGFDGPDASICYLYALGTPPEFRGRGLGGRTIWYAGSECYRRGADFVCFLPAAASLAAWYGEILGTRAVFFRRSGTVAAGGDAPSGTLEKISPAAYAAIRKRLLAGKPHVEHPSNALQFQESCCQIENGGFCRITVDGEESICVLEIGGGATTILELLAPTCDPSDCARLILDRTHCRTAEVRTPAFWHTDFGKIEEDCILIPGGRRFPKSDELPYWGPAMD